MCAAEQLRVEALGPWRLSWTSEHVSIEAFGVTVQISPSQNDPTLTIVDVDKAAESELAVQVYQDSDLCREF